MTLVATNYDPNLVNVIVNGIPVKGIVDSIKVTRKDDKNSIVTSIDGVHSVFIENKDSQGTISFNIFEDNLVRSLLDGLIKLNAIIPISINDLNFAKIKFFPQCKIQKEPDSEQGKEQGKLEYTFIHTGAV